MPFVMQMLWPDFLKKRLCRYLLQHYLGHFFKEKISLEQLSIDIYNGTGCVKNLNLDCEALNEQISSAASSTTNASSSSSVPIEIVSGFVGYISVYIPWHDLFNDYCKLTIKNVQITIRVKEIEDENESNQNTDSQKLYDLSGEDESEEEMSSSNPAMFSSMFIDSIINTSMNIAQECLNEQVEEEQKNELNEEETMPSNVKNANSLLGLEAFASTIDSILSRIKINLEQIQIRVENLDEKSTRIYSNIMSSSTLINTQPSSGIALELRIKSIKYFDLDSVSSGNKQSSNSLLPDSSLQSQQQAQQSVVRNTTKSFNIEGLTVYFDEFVVKDDCDDLNVDNFSQRTPVDEEVYTASNVSSASLNSTVDLSGSLDESVGGGSGKQVPQDESAPFNFELNSDYYLYTNPVICLTFSGIQSTKLTINNIRPSDLMTADLVNDNSSSNQKPLLELTAQFGSIKCLLCPRQIHLLTEMFKKINDYVEAAEEKKKRLCQLRKAWGHRFHQSTNKNKPIRGGDKRKLEALIQNDLMFNNLGNRANILTGNEDIEDENDYKSILITENNNDTSSMFYSMMSESINNPFMGESEKKNVGSDQRKETPETGAGSSREKQIGNKLKRKIEQLQNDTILHNNNNNKHNMFQTFKLTFRMLSLTVLHRDPQAQKGQTSPPPLIQRLIVSRIKSLSDLYFDMVSTIDANSSSSGISAIDKTTISKYHQACAFNDHFLVILKPINCSVMQKISQHVVDKDTKQPTIVQYSFTDASITCGYIQLNEYLNANSNNSSVNSKTRQRHLIEASKSATITELLHFKIETNRLLSEQPCFKLQLVIYDPLDLKRSPCKPYLQQTIGLENSSNHFFHRSFENIVIQLNQRLIGEIDISLYDRLYYLINDESLVRSTNETVNQKPKISAKPSETQKLRNLEVACSQTVELALRFPIVDLSDDQTNPSKQQTPINMLKMRNLRDQILTFHLFDLHLQSLLDEKEADAVSLLFSSSQINAYYQYLKKERPIHFGLLQQKENESGSLFCSIKLPTSEWLPPPVVEFSTDSLEYDSLRHKFNINVGRANKLKPTTIIETNESGEEEEQNPNQRLPPNQSYEDDDDGSYGPFSRIHSLISSEKNRRIVNAGSLSEMATFVEQSISNSKTCIELSFPKCQLLIADQKFLNDIYNCFLNDLIMWKPVERTNQSNANTACINCLIDEVANPILANSIRKDEQSSESSSDEEEQTNSSKTKQKSWNKQNKSVEQTKNAQNTLCLVVRIDQAHLKAFVLNNIAQKPIPGPDSPLKYGEFDITTSKFEMCLSTSENETANIEKQFISIVVDQIAMSHATKTGVGQLKLPTNYAMFEQLFHLSKTNPLIGRNESQMSKWLINESSEEMTGGGCLHPPNQPMVSIGIKSKFDLKKNTKQLLVALNFNDLILNHMFCLQPDYWIFQLIVLFDLIDIEIAGYEAPIALTELHLNVANSCIDYRPLFLNTSSLIAFKSLHWSSNVTAESTLTLLVFNIEDMYLFLSKTDQANFLNLRKDYVCIANSYLFELRLLISDDIEQQNPPPKLRQKPILDIKIRSNLIQIRTCVDSAFALIELINYIVSDGDLHQPSPILSELLMNQQTASNATPSSPLPPLIEQQQQPQSTSVEDEIGNAIGSEMNTTSVKKISSSIPIQSQQTNPTALFTVGTPPPSSSFKSSSSSASLISQQQFYSPVKQHGQSSPDAPAPLPSPSLSYNFRIQQQPQQLQHNVSSSSAESLISDMVKEAMTATTINPMTQSIMGSLDPLKDVRQPQRVLGLNRINQQPSQHSIGGRKRNTSLTLTFPDMQTKRMIGGCSDDLSSINKLVLYKDDLGNLFPKTESNPLVLTESKNELEENKENKEILVKEDQDEILIRSIDKNNFNRMNDKDDKSDNSDGEQIESNDERDTDEDDDDEFQFGLPFSDLSPLSMIGSLTQDKTTSKNVGFNSKKQNSSEKCDYLNSSSTSALGVIRPIHFERDQQKTPQKTPRRLYFKPNNAEDSSDEDSTSETTDQHDPDDELLRDFDIIDVIPGFGEPPRNNQDFEIKCIRNKHFESPIQIKEDHFKKPLSKIDVLKAPDSYPVPLNVYCVQEISVNWCLYGGSDFISAESKNDTVLNETIQSNNRMNRTVSSPIIVAGSGSQPMTGSPSTNVFLATRSRNNSTSSNFSLSISPTGASFQSPPKPAPQNNSPSSAMVKFSGKTASINFTKEKCLPRKAGGRIFSKYDTAGLNWLARGGVRRNLDVCMEIALQKLKTKIDLYSEWPDNSETGEQPTTDQSPYLYRVALAIGDIEIRDKLASSAFNMFLFRYESEHCPKHTNSNMIFLKFLCSKSMDLQRLLECDIKLSIQPLRFNIDQDALIFLVDFFTKLTSKDLNKFSQTLQPPAQSSDEPSTVPCSSTTTGENGETFCQPSQPPQQVFIRNFIFSPDLLVKFDFSGKYDKRPDTKMDTITKFLMVAVQLSNTEIKLKKIYYRRGFLGVEKLIRALLSEWLTDIQRNQMKNIIKGWGIFNSLIQFFEGFTYLIWYPIEQYKKDGRVLCGIQKGSAAFSTCTVLATIELTNRMFQVTKNVAEFFYDLVTPHRNNSHHFALVETILTNNSPNSYRNIRLRRQPNDLRAGLTNAYYVMYEGINDTAANWLQEVNEGAEHKGLPGAIGGGLRALPSTALAPIILTAEASSNILSGIRNQLKPDEKKDDDQKWKHAFN